jgi:HD-like signal output (HDOD) protein
MLTAVWLININYSSKDSIVLTGGLSSILIIIISARFPVALEVSCEYIE